MNQQKFAPCVVKRYFDTSTFRVPFYRVVNLDIDCLRRQIPPLLREKPLIVDAKVPADRSDIIRLLENFGFRIVCTQISLLHDLAQPSPAAVPVTVSKRLDLDEHTRHAHVMNFQFDRFSLDPLIDPSRRERLYDQWIKNSLSGAMQVAAIGGNFCSFEQQGDLINIDLLSVLNKRQGIGRNLVRAVLEYAVQRKMRATSVVTECGNIAAWHTYLGLGFRVRGFIDCLHFVST